MKLKAEICVFFIFCAGKVILGLNITLHPDVFQLEKAVQQLNASITLRDNQISELQQKVSKLEATPQGDGTAFYAYLSHPLHVGENQAIEFNNVVTNVGNAYDKRHGHFTAPSKGLYMIASSIVSDSSTNVSAQIVKNGAVVAFLYSPTIGYESSSVVLPLVLDAGDMVWIRHGMPTQNTMHTWSMFSGFQIQKYP